MEFFHNEVWMGFVAYIHTKVLMTKHEDPNWTMMLLELNI